MFRPVSYTLGSWLPNPDKRVRAIGGCLAWKWSKGNKNAIPSDGNPTSKSYTSTMPLGWGVDIPVSYTLGPRLPNTDKRMPMRNQGVKLVDGLKKFGLTWLWSKGNKNAIPSDGNPTSKSYTSTMPLGWGVDIAVSYTQGSRLPNPDKRMPMRNKGGELVGG